MEPTDTNLRAWEEAHKRIRRSSARGSRTLPKPVRELVLDLPEEHEVRRYAEEKMELLDRLGHASGKAHEGPRVRRDVPGWEEIPSSAPADEPLPRRR